MFRIKAKNNGKNGFQEIKPKKTPYLYSIQKELFMKYQFKIAPLLISLMSIILVACGESPQNFSIYDGLTDSDSSKFQNIVTQFIVEHGFGDHVIYLSDDSKGANKALLEGKVDLVHSLGQESIMADGRQIRKVGDYFISKNLMDSAPKIAAFLAKMHIDEDIVTECLQWADDKETDFDAAALYFLLNNQSKWSTWLEEENYQATKKSMRELIAKHELKDEF
jgi:hypothetical protein